MQSHRSRVLFPFFLFRGTVGLTLGLYLYTAGSVIFDGFAKAGQSIFLFGLSMGPLEWTAFVFSFGILQEMFLEVPTGVVADSLGRRFATLLNLVFRCLYFLFLFFIWWEGQKAAPSALLLVIYAVLGTTFFSIHYSLMSGSFVAWFKDALDDIGESEHFAYYLNVGQMTYSGLYMLGSLLGVYLKIINRVDVAYLGAFGLCVVSAVFCRRIMPENKNFTFYKISDLVGSARHAMVNQAAEMFVKGLATFKKDSRLWVVFANVAAVYSVLYVIDYVWLIYVRSQFGSSLQTFSLDWLYLILAFAASDFVGAFAVARWFKSYEKKFGAVSGSALVTLNASLSVFFVLPIFVTAWFPPSLNLFIACMAVHRLAWGALHGPLDALQNAYIPERSQERTTVLSLGACIKNVLIMALFFFGVGKDAGSMTAWVIPCAAVVGSSVFMLVWIRVVEKRALGLARA